MNTKTTFIFLPFWLLSFAAAASAQSQMLQFKANAEYRDVADQPEAAKQLALDAARRKVLQDAVARLQDMAEVRALSFKSNQMDALLPAIAEVDARLTQAGNRADRNLYTATAEFRLGLPETVRTLNKLRKDPDAVAGLMEVWRQTEECIDN